MGPYQKPETIDEALACLSAGHWVPVAGCTDYYCRPSARPLSDPIIDLSGIDEARGIVDAGGSIRLGALTTWSQLAAADLPAQFDALREAALKVGGVQIQNAATIGGNICNASPAADGVPPLLILDAAVELRSVEGARVIPLADFLVDNRSTLRRDDELLTALIVRGRSGRCASRFRKLGARSYLVISIVMVAALLEVDEASRIAAAAIAVGACSPVARRLPLLEAALLGQPVAGRPLSCLLRDDHLAPLRPLSDVRGTAEYRRDAAQVLVARVLDEVQEQLR